MTPEGERRVIASAAIGHSTTHALELTFAALLVRIGDDFGVSLAALGAVATAGSFTFGATAIPSGFLTDRLGPRTVITACMAVAGGCAALVALAPNVWLFAIALSLLGAAIGFYHPAGTAMVSTVDRRRGMAFAAHGIAGNLGVALAPALAVGVAIALDWRASFGFGALLGLVAAAVVFAIAPSREEAAAARRAQEERANSGGSRTTPPEPRRWLAGPLLLVFAVSVGMGFIYRGALTFMPAHLEENLGFSLFGWSPEALAGALSTVVLLWALAGQVLGGFLSDRMPVERAAVPITLLAIPLLALGGLATGVPMLVFLAGFVVMNFAQQPVINGLMADYAPPGATGRAYGAMFFATFGIGSIAGVIAGAVADAAGTDATFYLLACVAAAIAAGTMAIAVGADRRRREYAARAVGEAVAVAPSPPGPLSH